ncbi:hypothetical protein GCM10018790_75710 [Kitasatospora xanthocidica]|nr:hypothetical protein GCM10018790_75710 [Kitasatospora xanthocidica]
MLYSLSHGELVGLLGTSIELDLAGMEIFGVGNDRIQGIVTAGGYAIDEGSGEFWEPSSILKFDR